MRFFNTRQNDPFLAGHYINVLPTRNEKKREEIIKENPVSEYIYKYIMYNIHIHTHARAYNCYYIIPFRPPGLLLLLLDLFFFIIIITTFSVQKLC